MWLLNLLFFHSIGYFRGKIVLPELRNTTLAIPRWPNPPWQLFVFVSKCCTYICADRILTLLITMAVLSSIHHSPMLMLITCAFLNGAAAYLQITYVRPLLFIWFMFITVIHFISILSSCYLSLLVIFLSDGHERLGRCRRWGRRWRFLVVGQHWNCKLSNCMCMYSVMLSYNRRWCCTHSSSWGWSSQSSSLGLITISLDHQNY